MVAMPIPLSCSECAASLRVPDNLAGKRIRCPKCHELLDVPAAKIASEKPAASKGAAAKKAPGTPENKPAAKPKPKPRPAPADHDAEKSRRGLSPLVLWGSIGGGAVVLVVGVVLFLISGSSTPQQPVPVQNPNQQAKPAERVPFDDKHAVKLDMKDGAVAMNAQITATDPLEPRDKRPCKLFHVALEAGHRYHVSAENPNVPLQFHLEAQDGRVVDSEFDIDLHWGRPELRLYPVKESSTYRLVVRGLTGEMCGFELRIRDTALAFPAPAPKELQPVPLPKPESVDRPLPSKLIQADRRLPMLSVDFPMTVHELCLSKDGRHFFVLEQGGLLRRVRVEGLHEEKRLALGRKCGSLSAGKDHLLAAVVELQEVWRIDPETLEVTQRLSAPGLERVTAQWGVSFAFAGCRDENKPPEEQSVLLRLDLDKWETSGLFKVSGHNAALTPDGKYLFTQVDATKVSRWRPDGARLFKDGANFTIDGPFLDSSPPSSRLVVSPDSKYVFGESRPEVYAVTDLSKPAFTLGLNYKFDCGVGFDPAAGLIYGGTKDGPLVVMNAQGKVLADYLTNQQGGGWHPRVREVVALPEGRKLLVRHDKGLYYTEVGKQGEPALTSKAAARASASIFRCSKRVEHAGGPGEGGGRLDAAGLFLKRRVLS